MGDLGISWEMMRYERISKDISGDSGYPFWTYPCKDILIIPSYPDISC
jgi:hypothetical protein